tara:strand:+ start:51 stop:980 length:930 start_codon:yes stop_codon:yes gene_type:complete
MKLSIVTTLHQSSEYIEEFYNRITKEANNITNNYEVIFVDDGSPDDSLQKAISLYEKDKKVRILELSRNFGHHKAIMIGLSYAKGDFVFLIDVDLEEEPELLSEFWRELQKNENLDVVYGVQKFRKGSFFERVSGSIFYYMFNLLSDFKTPKNLVTVKLMKQNFVKNLVLFKEREVVFSVVNSLTGFNSKEYSINKLSHSPSSYSFTAKFVLFIKTIASASPRPLWVVFFSGLFIVLLSLIYTVFIVFRQMTDGILIDGWTSLMVLTSFFGGVIIFILGLLGVYVSIIFTEVKQRPYSIIRKKYGELAE